ncbi:hypothetical protein [Thiomonas sp. FB-Cd]|uniref:hypothetical protein n=1 Tax=Thiomonas sp. FB-Cd TaxID=1158292 RepID=UPI0004DFBE09|nr:hypothetical protein [Thiomonas sp. FB-Cd]
MGGSFSRRSVLVGQEIPFGIGNVTPLFLMLVNSIYAAFMSVATGVCKGVASNQMGVAMASGV